MKTSSRQVVENEIRNLHEMTHDKYRIAGSISHTIMGCSFTMDLKTRRLKIKPLFYDMVEYTMYVGFQYCYQRIREAPTVVYPRIQKVLNELLIFRLDYSFFRPKKVLYNPNAPNGLTAMMLTESAGLTVDESSEPSLLADYLQGKANREFVINQWIDGVYDRGAEGKDPPNFFVEEYAKHPGFTDELSMKLFGRKPNRIQ